MIADSRRPCVPAVSSHARWPASVGSMSVPRRSFGSASRRMSPAASIRSSRLVIAPLERWMSSASSPADRRYGGPTRRSRPSTLNARRSSPNSARLDAAESSKPWASIWIRSTIPSVNGSRSGISRAQMTSEASRWSSSSESSAGVAMDRVSISLTSTSSHFISCCTTSCFFITSILTSRYSSARLLASRKEGTRCSNCSPRRWTPRSPVDARSSAATMRASRGDRAGGSPGPRHRAHPPRRGDAGRDQGLTVPA